MFQCREKVSKVVVVYILYRKRIIYLCHELRVIDGGAIKRVKSTQYLCPIHVSDTLLLDRMQKPERA